jgi:hypothetical protein
VNGQNRAKRSKSFLLLFFKKEVLGFLIVARKMGCFASLAMTREALAMTWGGRG